MSYAICAVEGAFDVPDVGSADAAEDESTEWLDVRAEVCFLVTILEIGVVMIFASEPAMYPMRSSSRTGSTTAASEATALLDAIRRRLRKL